METKFVSNCADEIESFKLREFKEGISPQGRFKSRSVAPIMLSAKTHLMMTSMTPLDKRLALCEAVYLLHWISPVVFIKHCICVHVVWGEAHSSLHGVSQSNMRVKSPMFIGLLPQCILGGFPTHWHHIAAVMVDLEFIIKNTNLGEFHWHLTII